MAYQALVGSSEPVSSDSSRIGCRQILGRCSCSPEIAIASHPLARPLRLPGFRSVGSRAGNLLDDCGWLQFRPRLRQPVPLHRAFVHSSSCLQLIIQQVQFLSARGEQLSALGWIAVAAALSARTIALPAMPRAPATKNDRLDGSGASSWFLHSRGPTTWKPLALQVGLLARFLPVVIDHFVHHLFQAGAGRPAQSSPEPGWDHREVFPLLPGGNSAGRSAPPLHRCRLRRPTSSRPLPSHCKESPAQRAS